MTGRCGDLVESWRVVCSDGEGRLCSVFEASLVGFHSQLIRAHCGDMPQMVEAGAAAAAAFLHEVRHGWSRQQLANLPQTLKWPSASLPILSFFFWKFPCNPNLTDL